MKILRYIVSFCLIFLMIALILIIGYYYLDTIDLIVARDFKIWQIIIIYIQLIVEFFIFYQVLIFIYGLIPITIRPEISNKRTKLTEYPDVDVIVPIRRVDENILEKTLIGINNQTYPQNKIHIYIGDDTPETEKSQVYSQLATKYNANYVYDPKNKKFKSGMLNIVLKKCNSEFVAFFDHDQIPQKNIFVDFIEILTADQDASYVQAKKTFINLYNLARVWSALLYLQFFEVIERTKAKSKTIIFAGSTACFRRKSINQVGGIPETTFTEDSNLSLKLMANGLYGIFLDKVGSIGTVPNGYEAQIAQLWRWSHGGSHTLNENIGLLIKSKNLSLGQKMDTIGVLALTPVLLMYYVYVLTFIPLFFANVDSPRPLFHGVSLIIMPPICVSLTYIFLAIFAVYFSKLGGSSEFKYKQLIGFFFIALASNILIIGSGLRGIFGRWGPNSLKGEWTRKIAVLRMSFIYFIIGCVGVVLSIMWLLNGLTAATLILIMCGTLIQPLMITYYYTKLAS